MKKYLIAAAALAVFAVLAYAAYSGIRNLWARDLVKPEVVYVTPDPGADRELMPPVSAPENTWVLTVPPETLDITGMVLNPLSGLYIDEDAVNRRPFAVVFNNNEASLPQSGLSQADIVYEVISEGSITRIIGIFQDFDSAKIGSVRSARHYFIDLALDHDAFFVHFGGSPQAYQAIKDLKINSLNGIYLDGGVRAEGFDAVTFWRDAERYRVAKMREHSGYTNAENLIEYAEEQGWRMEKREDAAYPFLFYEEPQSPQGDAVSKISVSYAGGNPAVFEYDADRGVYARSQFKGPKPQIDEETGLQIEVDNVIVQLTSVKSIPGDTEGRRDVGVIGSGDGFLFTGGGEVPIKWSKSGHNSPTVWTFDNGDPLTVNKGKTWICITNKEPEIE